MLKTTLIASSMVLLFACNNENSASGTNGANDTSSSNGANLNAANTLTEEEKKDGWELLFDGSTTKGWHKYGEAPRIGSAWKVDDGSLHLDASKKKDWQIQDGGDIVSDSAYDNFDLKLDWKIDTAGNSGIIIYIVEDTSKYEYCWHTGPEMQVLDNAKHPDAKIVKHRAGDLYDLISSSSEPVKPALEWNHVEIKSLNGKLDLYLNGVNVVSTTMWDDNWRTLIAGSKFKNMPDFGKFKKGKIGLQDHGNNVWFRNIKIKRL
ncbi:MAG: 3-keto-disaccharide hydrolase [Chitinophagaceae bacterium]